MDLSVRVTLMDSPQAASQSLPKESRSSIALCVQRVEIHRVRNLGHRFFGVLTRELFVAGSNSRVAKMLSRVLDAGKIVSWWSKARIESRGWWVGSGYWPRCESGLCLGSHAACCSICLRTDGCC